ncbi:hypothetical protein, partial [Microbacterium sp. 16-032]|uniref:hypothetical protein n=1 Tax=Microbacterium sp. 16-032 TaxID=3239808 RepID=UPI0034E1F36C
VLQEVCRTPVGSDSGCHGLGGARVSRSGRAQLLHTWRFREPYGSIGPFCRRCAARRSDPIPDAMVSAVRA